MKNGIFNSKFLFVSAAILLAAFSRIIPHPFNFSPLGAMALFSAAYFTDKKFAFIIPIFATFISDLFINNVIYSAYNPTFVWYQEGSYWIYGTYAIIAFAGLFIYKNGVTKTKVIGGSLMSTALFFLLTNFACFPGSTIYTQNMSGLISCYAAGVPFLQGSLLGDLFYSTLLFGSYEYAKRRIPALL